MRFEAENRDAADNLSKEGKHLRSLLLKEGVAVNAQALNLVGLPASRPGTVGERVELVPRHDEQHHVQRATCHGTAQQLLTTQRAKYRHSEWNKHAAEPAEAMV